MKGNKIKLRALEPDDINLLYSWENDSSIWHLSHTLVPFSKFDLEQYVLTADKDIYKARQVRLMIVKNDDNIPVGAIDLFDFNPLHQRLGLGIMVDKKERKQGFAPEALDLTIDYCFHKLMVHQIYVNILPDNTQSIKLFEEKNFLPVAKKRDWLLIDNCWHDEWLFQLINPHHPQVSNKVPANINL